MTNTAKLSQLSFFPPLILFLSNSNKQYHCLVQTVTAGMVCPTTEDRNVQKTTVKKQVKQRETVRKEAVHGVSCSSTCLNS